MISLQRQTYWIGRAQIALGVAVLLGIVLFYLLIFRPATNVIGESREQVAILDQQLARNEETVQDLPAIEREVQRLREQITHSRVLPNKQELPQFIRDITHMSQENRLDQFRYEPDAERQRTMCYELPVTMMFEGNFADVANFLRQAEQMSRLTRTRKLQLKAKDGTTGTVAAEVAMNIYFMGAK